MVFCVVFVAWQPVPLVLGDQLPEAVSRGLRLGYLFLVTFGFFGWFWTHGGQTIGMRAWKIRLVSDTAPDQPGNNPDAGTDSARQWRNPSWRQALMQYLLALVSWGLGGLGYIASLWHPQRRTWHDRGAGTILIMQRR